MRDWRKSTWAIVIWTVLVVVLAGWALADVLRGAPVGGSTFERDSYFFGVGIVLTVFGFVWFVGFIVLGIVWLVSRPRTDDLGPGWSSQQEPPDPSGSPPPVSWPDPSGSPPPGAWPKSGPPRQ